MTFSINPLRFGTTFVVKRPAPGASTHLQQATTVILRSLDRWLKEPEHAWHRLAYASPDSQNIKVHLDPYLMPNNQKAAHVHLGIDSQPPIQLRDVNLETDTDYLNFIDRTLFEVQKVLNFNGKTNLHFPAYHFDPAELPQDSNPWSSQAGNKVSQQYWADAIAQADVSLHYEIATARRNPTPFLNNPELAQVEVQFHPAGELWGSVNPQTNQSEALFNATVTLPNGTTFEKPGPQELATKRVSDFLVYLYAEIAQHLIPLLPQTRLPMVTSQ